jgi:precorrin-6B methylase 2
MLAGVAVLLCGAAGAQTPAPAGPYKPTVGQSGKDAVWVPTSAAMVEKMLDMAGLTPDDFVMDLGSGDGRTIIAAARRGARGIGVEYNPELVELSAREAAAAGVADKASFVQGDMYAADISKATVMALFLLPRNLEKLAPKFLELQPGARLVANTFWIDGWTPDATETLVDNCDSWCTAMLFVVPARVQGTWRLPDGELALTQSFQMLEGTLTAGATTTPVKGRLRGREITWTAGTREFSGRVEGDTMTGTAAPGGAPGWTAKRVR